MNTLLCKDYVLEPVTVNDLQLASLAWGFTIGFGFLTTWTAMKQTAHTHRRYTLSKLKSPYIWMIWLEILVCVIFSVICWLYLKKIIPPRYMQFHPFVYIVKLNIEMSMADLIAKVSRSSTPRIDSSGVYSHAISQLASDHYDAQLTFPVPAKVASTTKHHYDSDVELNDIMYGKEFAPDADFEMDLKRDAKGLLESVDSSDSSVKEGEREIGMALTEEDMRPLKHGGAKQARESKYGVGVDVHTKAWSCESGISGC